MQERELKPINKNVKALRKHVGKTQEEFAELLQNTQANISQIENGACLPGTELVLKITEKHPDLNMNWFFKSEGPIFEKKTGNKFQNSEDRIVVSSSLNQKEELMQKEINELRRQINELKEDKLFYKQVILSRMG